MAKAERQKSPVLVDGQGRKVRVGSVFHLGNSTYTVKALPEASPNGLLELTLKEEIKASPVFLALHTRDEGDGCSLHLMEEEAILLRALTSLVAGMHDATPAKHRAARSVLDGKHDLAYWLKRVATALSSAGYKVSDARVDSTYWELARLFETFQKSQ